MRAPEHPNDLRVEFRRSPNNVPTQRLRFSWRLGDTDRGGRQTAYRIVVGRDPDLVRRGTGEVWDSGRVRSSRSTNVEYGGPQLASDTDYHWAVRVWDEAEQATGFSDAEPFTTALRDGHEWRGEWISHQPGSGDSNGYRSHWAMVGESPAPEWLQLDLGSSRDIDQIELYPAGPFDTLRTPDGFEVTPVYSPKAADSALEKREHVWGFGFPVRYRIDVDDDPAFESPRTIVDRTGAEQSNPGSDPVRFDVEARGQYLRMTATELFRFDPAVAPQLAGGSEVAILGSSLVDPARMRQDANPWAVFALGAIGVRDADGTDVARNVPVDASSSVENQTWGAGKLVDGAYEPSVASTSPLLRTEVTLSKRVTRARAHVSTPGYGEFYVNGERIGDDRLSPAWTKYDTRLLYSTYEVGDRLHEGRNAIGLWLGRGFFSKSALQWTGHGSPRAIMQLSIEFEDGSTREVVTDGSWRAAPSPITENDVYAGERYDAREEQPGWARPAFDDSTWSNVTPVSAPGGDLYPRHSPPVRTVETFRPQSIERRSDGYIIDFGQNLTGWVELAMDSPTRGSVITVRHAEILDEEGFLSTADLGDATATDTYVARGEEHEAYEPRFTYHGFQYAHVEGYPDELSADRITAKAVHTDMMPRGSFDCSNDDLAAVQHASEWTLRGNSVGIPTDCPQRSERFGWTCDAHISAGALLYNFDAVRFYEQWLGDLEAEQSRHGCLPDTAPFAHGTKPGDPSWTLARILIPWYLYRFDGDRTILEAHYDGMRAYADFWHALTVDDHLPAEHGNYGDWLAFEHQDPREPRIGQPVALFNTASHFRATSLMARIAGVLGHESDERRYRERSERIATAFNDRYLDEDRGIYEPRTQAANAIPLSFGITPESAVPAVAENLAALVQEEGEGRLRTGFIGTPALIHALAEHGYGELAYNVVSQPERPGWVYMVNHAVTSTLWERWDSDEAVGTGMNSFNHQYRACVSEWFYKHLAGIRFDEERQGPRHVKIEPLLVDDLEWVVGEHEAYGGRIASSWERNGDGYELQVEIPWNTSATVRVPVDDSDAVTIREGSSRVWDGDGVKPLPTGVTSATRSQGDIAFEVESGQYLFEVRH